MSEPTIETEALTSEETEALREQGRQAVLGVELQLPPMTDEALKEFVFGYCDGNIWTDKDVPQNMIQMVFMPLVFGGLSIPDEVIQKIAPLLPLDPGKKPNPPEKPNEATLLGFPEAPKEPVPEEPDPKRLEQIQFHLDWQVTTPDELARYERQVRERNIAARAEYEKALADWERTCEDIRCKNVEVAGRYASALSEFKAKEASFEADLHAWVVASARHNAAMSGASAQYLSDLGLVWADTKKDGTSPMACNGYPCFFSMRFMGKADVDRALKAVQREMEHRMNFSL